MDSIIITRRTDDGTFGTMTWVGGAMAGRLPPDDAELRAVYDRLIAADVKPQDAQPFEPPMPDISDRQFGEGLWRDGLISYDAYIAFVGPGTLPPLFDEILQDLPDTDDPNAVTPRKVARGLVTGAQRYEFANAFVPIFQAAMERRDPAWTNAHLRERWRAFAKL